MICCRLLNSGLEKIKIFSAGFELRLHVKRGRRVRNSLRAVEGSDSCQESAARQLCSTPTKLHKLSCDNRNVNTLVTSFHVLSFDIVWAATVCYAEDARRSGWVG